MRHTTRMRMATGINGELYRNRRKQCGALAWGAGRLISPRNTVSGLPVDGIRRNKPSRGFVVLRPSAWLLPRSHLLGPPMARGRVSVSPKEALALDPAALGAARTVSSSGYVGGPEG